ncbi:MAG TPA: sugar transferase [Stenomitos sp.]
MSAEFTNVNQGGVSSLPAPLAGSHPSLHGLPGLSKRLFDLSFALLGLVLALPVMLAIAVLIKLDSPGPVLFKQRRVGLNGREFWMYKFRTMGVDAEARHRELLAYNEMKDGVIFKMSNDPRVTKIGRILRRSSLDELPQLYNVIRREMSLIGPRPLPTYEVAKHEPHHLKRLGVLPGCTGLWQVSGRNQIDSFHKMVELDLTYIQNWSVAYDWQILFRTVTAVFTATGSC